MKKQIRISILLVALSAGALALAEAPPAGGAPGGADKHPCHALEAACKAAMLRRVFP